MGVWAPPPIHNSLQFVELIELVRMTKHGRVAALDPAHKTVPYSCRSPDSVFANIYFNANSYSSRSCLGLELQKFCKHLAAGFIFMAAGRAAAVFIKAEHRPGFHKRWSADPQPVPIGGTYFTICSLQPEVPSCRSCSSAALISCSPSRTSTLATYFNIWTIVHNYTHQKPSKEGL